MGERIAKTFRLSEETLRLLKAIAEKNSRTDANMLEVLIKDAARREKIK